MNITKTEAKSIGLELWSYFIAHPAYNKYDLIENNPELNSKVMYMLARCPLCEYYKVQCSNCPLNTCFLSDSYYSNWLKAVIEIAKTYNYDNKWIEISIVNATKIYETILAW